MTPNAIWQVIQNGRNKKTSRLKRITAWLIRVLIEGY
jgi:hypothetical protein